MGRGTDGSWHLRGTGWSIFCFLGNKCSRDDHLLKSIQDLQKKNLHGSRDKVLYSRDKAYGVQYQARQLFVRLWLA